MNGFDHPLFSKHTFGQMQIGKKSFNLNPIGPTKNVPCRNI